MSTTQRKRRRRGILVERAQQAAALQAQVEKLQTQATDTRQLRDTVGVLRRQIAHQQDECTDLQRRLVEQENINQTLHDALEEARPLLADRATMIDRIERLERALTDRGDHIEQLISERDRARAARDVADKRYYALLDEDRSACKLRRRLREAKATIADLQAQLCQFKRRRLADAA